jgi:hypothetical protein
MVFNDEVLFDGRLGLWVTNVTAALPARVESRDKRAARRGPIRKAALRKKSPGSCVGRG